MAGPLALIRRAATSAGALWLALAPLPARAESPRVPPPAVLTFTGAASRGAYQAGLAHAVLRTRTALADGPIIAAVGVSAGGINAALAALTSCRTDLDRTAALDSPLWRAWAALDWSAMFPHGLTCGEWQARFGGGAVCQDDRPWGPDDGIATLNALRPVERLLLDLLATPSGWREGCRVPLGVGLSAAMPADVPFTAAPLSSLRVHALVEVRVLGGRARICAAEPADPRFVDHSAETLTLPEGPELPDAPGCRPIDPQDFWRLVRAGAAPPVYAGAQPVEVCADAGRPVPAEDRLCAPGTRPVMARFLDGALLEAIPVGLSLAAGRVLRPDAGFEVLALDATLPEVDAPVPDGVIGYAWYRRFFRTFLEVSRYYEAQTIARYQESAPGHGPVVGIAHVRTPRRIFGDDLMGMGAFVSPVLRRADFRRGELSAYTVMLPRLCYDAPERGACGLEVLTQTGALEDDELATALLATPAPADEPPELAAARARFVAAGASPQGRTAGGCEIGALLTALANSPAGARAGEDALGAGHLAEVLTAAEGALDTCAARFPGTLTAPRLPDGRPWGQFPGWLLESLRHMTERLRVVETGGTAVQAAERLMGYALEVQRAGQESGVQVGSLPLGGRPDVPAPLRVLEHALLPVSFGGLAAPDGGLVVHWEYFAWTPARPFTPLGLGTSLRWFYRPAENAHVLGFGPTAFSLWDPRRHLLLSTLGLRATWVPDFTAGDAALATSRVDMEVLWRLLGSHLELAAGPSAAVRPSASGEPWSYRVIVSLASLNLLFDTLLH